MANTLSIGNAQAFWGDRNEAALQLILEAPHLQYITFDYLAEISMSILAMQREKDPSKGYAQDFIEVVKSLIPYWEAGGEVKLISNAGGLNPKACAEACAKVLQNSSCRPFKIAYVVGDNVIELLQQNSDAPYCNHLDTKEPLAAIADRLVSANAYLGGRAIANALATGANIIITGRVADPSLTVGACLHHFQWQDNEYDKIAGATVAGHLIECGTQVTGGIATNWLEQPQNGALGYPIVEVNEDGSFVITKPAGTGGEVSIRTVKEQLLYEIGDPGKYLSPDATVSFLSLELAQEGTNRVAVKGAKGSAPPLSYKVSASYKDGYKAEGFLAFFGLQAAKKAERAGEIIFERLKEQGKLPERYISEVFGTGAIVPGIGKVNSESVECLLRVAAADPREIILEAFSKELAPLVTSGPAGTTGYTSGRPRIRQIFAYWPCLVPTDLLFTSVHTIEV